MSVIIATSPNSPDSLAATSHYQNMARKSLSSTANPANAASVPRRSAAAAINHLGSSLPPPPPPPPLPQPSQPPTIAACDKPAEPHILKLANEQLLTILDFLEDDPNKSISFDRRAYLSQESFRPPPPPSATRAQDLGNWRRTCKRFSMIGAQHQFSRVTTRFSIKEFERLDRIASSPHLASEVRKFSYMVPYFFVDGRDRVQAIPTLSDSRGKLDVRVYQSKLSEQQTILKTRKDQHTLFKALSAFTRLQHVQILPVQDHQDRELLSWLRHNRHISQYLELDWQPACSHSTRTIGEALLKSQSPCTRFSSPHLEPQSAISLVQPGIFALLVSKLISIELHFDDGTEDLDSRMGELAPMLQAVFAQSAPNLQAVHVGFPSHRPISLRLEDIFHGVAWEKLLCFGVQGWKLDADEIIAMTTRHRKTLKGLRLRDVLLKEGSRWKDVLPHLKSNMTRLEWCSLRRVGYATHFDELWAAQGAEIPDLPLGGTSDSSDESSDGDSDGMQTDHQSEDGDVDMLDSSNAVNAHAVHINGNGPQPASSIAGWSQSNGYDSDQDSTTASTHSDHTDDEQGMAGNQMGFPSQVAPNHDRHATKPDTPSTFLWCNCSNQSIQLDLENAGPYSDNGVEVSNRTRKVWEKWIIGRCPVHDPSPS